MHNRSISLGSLAAAALLAATGCMNEPGVDGNDGVRYHPLTAADYYSVTEDGTQARILARIPDGFHEPALEKIGVPFALDSIPWVGAQRNRAWSQANQLFRVKPGTWNEEYEYWFSWWLLDMLSVHRQNLRDPREFAGRGLDGARELFLASSADAPFTRYFSPDTAEMLQGSLAGEDAPDLRFGILWDPSRTDTLVVGAFAAGSPAEAAGMRRNDRIIAIDGKPLVPVPSDAALSEHLSSDDPRHVFRFEIRRNGIPVVISAARGVVDFPTVYHDTLSDGTAYVRIFQFVGEDGDNTAELFEKAARALAGVAGPDQWLVLDLRDNSGGVIAASVDIAGQLLDRGDSLIRLHTREFDQVTLSGAPERTSVTAVGDRAGILSGRRIAVLVDSGTASSSEILLSALKTNLPSSHMLVVGETTYGKGIGQSPVETPLGGLAYITSLDILPVQGESYHHVGIAPDVVVPTDSALAAALRRIRPPMPAGRIAGSRAVSKRDALVSWNAREQRRHGPAPAMMRIGPFEVR